MTKPEAKRLACAIAARWVQQGIESWGEIPDGDGGTVDMDSADGRRVFEAFSELVAELDRRGAP